MSTTNQETQEVKVFTIFGKVITSAMDRTKVIKVLRTIPGTEVQAPRMNYVGYATVLITTGKHWESNEQYYLTYEDGMLKTVEYKKFINNMVYQSPQSIQSTKDWEKRNSF